MQKMEVHSLGQEYSREKEMATHSIILARDVPWTEGNWQATVSWGHKQFGHDLAAKEHQQLGGCFMVSV